MQFTSFHHGQISYIMNTSVPPKANQRFVHGSVEREKGWHSTRGFLKTSGNPDTSVGDGKVCVAGSPMNCLSKPVAPTCLLFISITYQTKHHHYAEVCWHMMHLQTPVATERQIWRAAVPLRCEHFQAHKCPGNISRSAWIKSTFIALCFSCKLIVMGKTVVASVRSACEKAILSWIILAEQLDLQETTTKDDPLFSCRPLQHIVCDRVI